MQYWPGTNIKKSKGNAFDWRNSASKIMQEKEFKLIQKTNLQKMGKGYEQGQVFTIYSKAKPSK